MPTSARTALTLAAAVATTVLVACGSTSDSSETSSATRPPASKGPSAPASTGPGAPTLTAKSPPSTPTRSRSASAAPSRHPARRTVPPRHPSKVLVVIEENHSYAQMRAGMPYLFGLSTRYGYATSWSAIRHPSLPNYLAITGGSTFGVTDDRDPAAQSSKVGGASSVFDQALDAGRTARTYAESMPGRCRLEDHSSGGATYAVRHNPWAYYPASRTRCAANDLPLTGFASAARASDLADVGFLIPNRCNDAHDCPLATADAFLQRTLPDVLASRDFTSGRLAVVVTADEDDKHSGNTVLTTVLSTRLSHKVVTTHLTHYSLTRYIAQVLGVAPLGNGAGAPDMKAAFGL